MSGGLRRPILKLSFQVDRRRCVILWVVSGLAILNGDSDLGVMFGGLLCPVTAVINDLFHE